MKTSLPVIGAEEARALADLTAQSFGKYRHDDSLSIAMPKVIRAGVGGGLPFESIVEDLFNGCLPATKICYGECFAAREAFERYKIDFGKRVKNILDPDILAKDLAAIPKSQAFMRSGWNSDLSWGWNGDEALMIVRLVRDAGKHPVILTKAFLPLSPSRVGEFADLGTELRVCVSAFDSTAELGRKFETMLAYRDRGGLAVPVVMTAAFKDVTLNQRQDAIVQHIIEKDLPGAENSIRFNPHSPTLDAIDVDACRTVEDSGDLWAGRLYPIALTVPTLSSVPASYTGTNAYRSHCDSEQLASLFADPVPTNQHLREMGSAPKPTCAGVPKTWI